MTKRLLPAVLLLLLAPLAPTPASAQTRYIAFGDSITFGFGDDPNRAEPGYPPRLQALLAQKGINATVVNQGLSGETVAGALSRLPRVLSTANPGDVLLLMEGTNDVNAKVSPETVVFNLDALARRAAASGLATVHATIIPRLPDANTDGTNENTSTVAALLRDLASTASRRLVDPFEIFFYQTPNALTQDYLGGDDKLHPNSKGYDLLAKAFADVLQNLDTVPPVPGILAPAAGEVNVPTRTTIEADLYDFGTGIDLTATKLQVNGQDVDATVTGNDRKLHFLYNPPVPLAGVISVGIRSRDKATVPNVLNRVLAQFQIVGTTFLQGDFNRDGRVDGKDLVVLALAFGARRFNDNFNLATDLNGDGSVDGLDLALLAANFGKSSF